MVHGVLQCVSSFYMLGPPCNDCRETFWLQAQGSVSLTQPANMVVHEGMFVYNDMKKLHRMEYNSIADQ